MTLLTAAYAEHATALEGFRERAQRIVTDTPDQGTRWPSLIIWGRERKLTRSEMVTVLADVIGYRDCASPGMPHPDWQPLNGCPTCGTVA